MKLPDNESYRIEELKKEITDLKQKLSQKYTPQPGVFLQEHELFEGIVDNIPVMITIYDPGLNNFRLNKALKDITGWTEEDAADGNLLAKVYPDPEYRQLVTDYMRSVKPGWRELVMTAKDGSHITSSWANINLHSGVQIGIGIDIRDRKKADAALWENEQRLQGLFSNAAIGIVITDSEDRISEVNVHLCDILGYRHEELMGKNITELTAPEDRSLSDSVNFRLHRGEFKTIDYEKRYLKRDGIPLWVHVTTSTVVDPSGKHINSIRTVEDISVRKEAEERVRESEERLRLAVESANLGTWDLDLLNDTAIRSLRHDQIWGYKEAQEKWGFEIAMRNVVEDDRQIIMDAYDRGIKSGKLAHENRVIWPDGSIHWIRAYGQFYYDAGNRPVRVMGIVEDITERKQAEADLIQSEARFKAVFQVTTEGIIIFDSKGQAVFVNEAEARLNGFPSTNDMMQNLSDFEDIFELFEPDGRKVPYSEWPVSRTLRGESVRNWELRVRRNDIEQEWYFNFNAEPVFDSNQKLMQAVLYTRDVTERKKAEDDLSRNRQELKSITDNSPDVIARFDRQLRHTFINPYGEKVYGINREEIIGKTNADLGMPQDNVDYWNKQFEGVFKTGAVQYAEFEFESPNFGLQYFFSVFVPEKNDKGDIVSVLAITRDITSRKAAEETIKEREEMFSNMVKVIPVGMALTNFSDRTIYKVNPAWLNITGYSGEEEVLGKTAEQLGLVRDQEAQGSYLDEFRKNGVTRNVEIPIYTKSDVQRMVSLNMDHVHFGGQKYIMVSIEDITEQKIMEQQLQKKNEELTQFIHTVSHDLKSPLVTIKSFTSYLQEDIEQDNKEAQARDIGYIVNAADRMGRLLDELLELSRIGRKEKPKSEFPMKAVAQSAADLVAGRISQRGVNVTITGPDVMLYGHQERLLQLYQNLIDNAVKFMGNQPQPLIEIGSYADNKNKVVLYVRDNGSGIDPKYHKKVFGIFEKLDNKAEGSGLGLALIKRIVEVHGGEIWVDSEGPGKGATFYFTIGGTRVRGHPEQFPPTVVTR